MRKCERLRRNQQRGNEMCGKIGSDEIESMQNMMRLAIYPLIAEAFAIDEDRIAPGSRLREDLGMTAALQSKLDGLIRDAFEQTAIDFGSMKTVADLLDAIIASQIEITPPGRR